MGMPAAWRGAPFHFVWVLAAPFASLAPAGALAR